MSNIGESIRLDIDDLILDPNNPRFSKSFENLVSKEEYESDDVQEEVLLKMLASTNHFEISYLAESIKNKGFIPFENIFVKKINQKYLVVEGNRRITAIKYLIQKHKSEATKNDILSESILNSMTKINCIDLTNNCEEEINYLLGLRHHGSIKQWSFLPASFNIFKTYMSYYFREYGGNENDFSSFRYDHKISKIIANLYSLKINDVRDKLRTYRAYYQLEHYPRSSDDLTKKFSIIGDILKKNNLRRYFNFDDQTFTFSDESVEKIIDLMYGTNDYLPIIKAAASGDSNVRDFSYIIENGTDSEIDDLLIGSQKPNILAVNIKMKKNEKNFINKLNTVYEILSRVNFSATNPKKLSGSEKERISEIQDVLKRIYNSCS